MFRNAVLAVLFLFPSLASAAPLKLLFLFPGGQGSSEAAQALLDSFTEALKKSGGPEMQATYLADKAAGLAFIQQQKPAAALLSAELFEEQGKAWNVSPVARSLQLPSGDGTETFYLVGKKGMALPASGKISVYSPRPFSPDYVAKRLFPTMSGVAFEILPTRNVLGDLRKIASGEKSGFLLLDPYEHRAMNLKAAWVAELSDLAASAKVPSAPVVVFAGGLSPEQQAAFQKALLQVGKDSNAQATLQELRLKGFAAP